MNLLYKILEKGVLFAFVLCFSFVSLYVPHSYHQVEEVEASGWVDGATLPAQITQLVELVAINGFTSISAASDQITSAMTTNSWLKDTGLDGIAWALAKGILSSMTSSIVNWINSGFKGSPAFVQNINKHLLDTADKAFGEYLEDLDGPFSFVCAPFKLDVKLALAIEYDQKRGVQGNSTASCTLTGALKNLDSFINNTQNFNEAGGWDAWFQVTSNPTSYTPYGNVLTAKADASARILNARGEEIKLLEFGDGFLSSKICEAVQGSGTSRENCFISTPGKVINEALTFQLSTGPESLIAADEINEIVAALFAQLAQKALTGAAGLLGLSSGGGSGSSITDQLNNSGYTSDPGKLLNLMNDSRNIELRFQVLASYYEESLQAFAANPGNDSRRRNTALNAASAIPAMVARSNANIGRLDSLIARYNAMSPVNAETVQAITQEYLGLSGLNTQITVDNQERDWGNLIRP